MSALARYWWLLVIGVLTGLGVALIGAHAKSAPVSHTAEATVLVTSSDGTYFRTDQGTSSGASSDTAQGANSPGTRALVDAANLYPLLIESDRVASLRDQMFGEVPGKVESQAIFASQTTNGFRESSVPVIQIDGTSSRKEDALALAGRTVEAFQRYIQAQQKAGRVVPRQRVRIQPLTSARIIRSTGGASYGLASLLGVAVIIAFGGLAYMLDSVARRASGVAAREPASTERA